jgi:hypothetical protein
MQPFLRAALRDEVLIGAIIGIVLGFTISERFGVSFTIACLWVALNFVLLGWLLGAATAPGGSGRLFLLLLMCAKIPAAYLLLYWLFSRSYLEAGGLVAGLTTLPVVILYRGLAGAAPVMGQARRSGRPDFEDKA